MIHSFYLRVKGEKKSKGEGIFLSEHAQTASDLAMLSSWLAAAAAQQTKNFRPFSA